MPGEAKKINAKKYSSVAAEQRKNYWHTTVKKHREER